MVMTNSQWLEEEFARGGREHWCMSCSCTTCGSFQMVELLTGNPVSGIDSYREALSDMTWARADDVVEGLRNCGPETNAEAIIWMLYMLWQRWGDRVHGELFAALGGTFAGDVLVGMRAHYARTTERSRLHLLRQGVKTKVRLE